MVTLRQINNFSIYNLGGLVATANPVLAQGQKIVEQGQASVVEVVIIVGSGLFAIVTVILYGLTLRKSISEGPSALVPTVFVAFLGLFVTSSSSLIIGQLTHNLIIAITVNLGIFIGILIVQLRVAILHR